MASMTRISAFILVLLVLLVNISTTTMASNQTTESTTTDSVNISTTTMASNQTTESTTTDSVKTSTTTSLTDNSSNAGNQNIVSTSPGTSSSTQATSSSQQSTLPTTTTTTSTTSSTITTTTTTTTTPTTTPKDCANLPPLLNGTIEYTSLSPKSTATFSCFYGYKLEGKTTLTCQANGTWDDKSPTCEVLNCDTPQDPNNGQAIFDSTHVNSTVTYSCNDGYHLNEVISQTCKEMSDKVQGSWDGDLAECVINGCDRPQDPNNGEARFDSTNVNSTVTYSCNDGYHLSKNVTQTCRETPNKVKGSWEGDPAKCVINDCGYPDLPINGKTNFSSTTVNSTAIFSCNQGYNLSGEAHAICTANGSWSVEPPKCVVVGVLYDAQCIPGLADNPCVTHNAICSEEEKKCLCSLDMFYNHANDTCVDRPVFPDGFAVYIEPKNVGENEFVVSWDPLHADMSVFGTVNSPAINFQNNFTETKDAFSFVKGLTSGSFYTVCIYVTKDLIPSNRCINQSTYTIPEAPTIANISKIWENNFTVYVTTTQDRPCEQYKLKISPSPRNITEVHLPRQDKITSFVYTNLTGAVNYTVFIYSVAGNFTSGEHFALTAFTRPPMLADASVLEQHNSSLKLKANYIGPLQDKIMYCIKIPKFSYLPTGQADLKYQCDITVSDEDKHVICTAESRFTVQGLKAGTEYTFHIYTCLQNLSSEMATPVIEMTRPDNSIQLNIKDWGETHLEVHWSTDFNDTAEKIKLYISSEHENSENLGTEITRNELDSDVYNFTSLQPGTKYKISAYTVIGNLSSENAAIVTSYTRPLPTDIISEEKLENGFNLTVNTSMFFNMLRITVVSADGKYQNTAEKELDDGSSAVEINNLTEGTHYNVSIRTIISFDNYTIESLHERKQYLFTSPGRPRQVTFPLPMLHEHSFVVNIDSPKAGNFDNYCVYLGPSKQNPQKNCTQNKEMSQVTFSNLNPGELYHISVYTRWLKTDSISGLPASIHTRPTPPESVVISSIEEQSFRIDVENKRWSFYSFIFDPPAQNRTNITEQSGNITVDGLKAGTLYNVTVYSIIGGISSERVKKCSSYTKPGQVDSVAVSENSNSFLRVNWSSPRGYYDKFVYNATCTSPNTYSIAPSSLSNYTVNSTALLSPLDPGTNCSISVVAVIINIGTQKELRGKPVPTNLNISTKEAAPSEVKLLHKSNLTHNSATVHWKNPDERNGIIRRYEAVLLQNEICRSKKIFSCTQAECGSVPKASEKVDNEKCNDSSISSESFSKNTNSFSWAIDRLHPFRNYSIEVVAYTVEVGAKANMSIETLEDRPGKPLSLSIKRVTSSTIDLTWEPPEERNGIVRNYTVKYKYARNNCYSKGETVSNKIISAKEPLNKIQLNGSDIHPFWTYAITVFATNNVGSGNSSAETNVTTPESKPGIIDNVTVGEPTAFNVMMSWYPPCEVNGMIQLYYICLTNESSTKHNLRQWKKCYNTTNIDVKNELNIFPYRNYTFSVSAVNSAGTGNLSEAVRIESPFASPERPTSVELTAVASDTIRAEWNTPSLFYGPVHYFVQAIDVIDQQKVYNTSTSTAYWTDSIVNSSSISGLDAFWEYNVTVYAVTGNERKKSQTRSLKTKEDNPGPVFLVYAVSESDVKKERSISVHWKPPTERDLNGVLTNYQINCTRIDDTSVTFTKFTSAIKTTFKFVNITPGDYNITVAAKNKAGIGAPLINTTRVEAGAPLKLVEETDSNLLIQPSPAEVADNKRQISVQLPLRNLLCNLRNGQPIRWGVVVVQDGNQNDIPFTGTFKEFTSKRLSVYKRWSQVKDDDSIPAYVATPLDWRPGCSPKVIDNRQKRSADPAPYENFVVGSQGECSGVPDDQYCNGELQPGRSYRAKAFVCTSGGCTETRYSNPVSTDPDLTVPIAAGTSSAIVVLMVVFVVVFILRRKQTACFAKDPERSTHTHRPGDDINLDKVEPTKKNSFSPSPIKLSDFPDTVEKMHRDSDLLFADAYKLLKEKSPNHPMTAAEQQCCRPKNRYTNILPFDHSRVKLRPSDDMEGSDYINANYIPGYTSRREYIATQGAMQATFDDFWRMIWEQNVDTIVMLTKLMEKGRHKCDKYWPDLGEPVFYGDLVVSLQSESNLSDYTIKIFEVKMKEERKMVRHFSYLKWPDMGCPETPELLLEFVKAVRQYTDRENRTTSGPTVVHCSAGVGRTGTFIAVDYLLQHIRDHDEVDIFNLVLEMRNHRLNMVQTEDQYVYIHECLKAFITTDEEEEEEEDGDEHVYVNTSFGAQEENIYENTAYQKD